MENQKTISMGKLNNFNKNKFKIIVFTAIITAFVMFSGNAIYKSYFIDSPNSNDIVHPVTLRQVTIAYSPEKKQIIFLNRKTGQTQLTLSDSVSMAIFALKSSEVITDYTSAMKNKK